MGNEDGAINICYIQKRLRKIRYNKSYMRDRRWKRREEKRSKGTQKEGYKKSITLINKGGGEGE